MSYLRHIHQCNLFNAENYLSFKVNGSTVGHVKHDFARQLTKLSDSFSRNQTAIHWETTANDFDSLNQAMDELTNKLLTSGLIPYRHGELYPVTTGLRDQVLFLMDRAVVPYFGIGAFGQHMNGYTKIDEEIHMWIARRSYQKPVAPGKLDHLVAGGLPYGISLQKNLAKECWEEAGIMADLAQQAQATGSINYRSETTKGLKPDTIYCYDLELPNDFTPHCTDGEVEEFYLWPLHQVAQLIHDTDEFKLNCNLVIIDFLIRHGFINNAHSEYRDLISGLS